MDADAVIEEWLERSGAYSPRYYAYHGPNETSERVREHLDATVGPDAAVLEVGCSSGRHLSHLHEHGYGDLHGVDVNEAALDVMADVYPDLAAAGSFHVAAIEDVVGEFEDGQFDAVYSVEALQHIHADNEWVFAELARVTADVLVTVEHERDDATRGERSDEAGGRSDEAGGRGDEAGGRSDPTENGRGDDGPPTDPEVTYVDDEFPLYKRDWSHIFTRLGFEQVHSEPVKRGTLRVFRAVGE